jgi:26S proteasome regulatory subunit N12
VLPPSQHQDVITGLNLLRLLAQNRVAEFHTELELVSPQSQVGSAPPYGISLQTSR